MNRSRISGSLFGAIRGVAGRAADAYRRHQDGRALEALPDHIRADIGLPRMDDFGRAARRPLF